MAKITKKAQRELTKRKLHELAKALSKHHQDVQVGLKNALTNAHRCGKILIQAKALVKHGSWKRWLNKNFLGSYETAADYMRVARCWNDDRLVEAREHDYVFTSIEEVLGILREERAKERSREKMKGRTDEPPTKPMTKRQKEAAIARCGLRDAFDYWLKDLTIDEVLVFETIFNQLEVGWWEEVVEKLHHRVCCELGHDPYDHTDFDEYLDDLDNNYNKNHPNANPYDKILAVGSASRDYDRRVGGDRWRCDQIFRRDQNMKALARAKVHKALNTK